MAIRINRGISFAVSGDGTTKEIRIDLRTHVESRPSLDNMTPSGVERVTVAPTSGTPLVVTAASVTDSVLSVTLAIPIPAMTPQTPQHFLSAFLLFDGVPPA
jgi:hypothetical protein